MSAIISDIVLILILLVGICVGLKLGFIKVISKPIILIGSYVLSFLLCKPIGNGIIAPMISTPVTNYLEIYLLKYCPDLSTESIPSVLKMLAGLFDVDISNLSAENIVAYLVENLAAPLVSAVAIMISFVILLIVSKLLLKLAMWFVNSLFDDTIIKIPNRIIGAACTLLLTAGAIWIGVSTFDFLLHTSLFAESDFTRNFIGGPVYRFFKNLNPLDLLLSF